jgi:deoxycytidine triphosphate deaminase
VNPALLWATMTGMSHNAGSDRGGEPGGVFGTQVLRRELAAGRLMEEGTYETGRLRPAGYDLVIARDGGLQVPSPADPDEPLEYAPGAEYPQPGLALQPGEFAFVATKEKLCLPWDVAANVAVKNGFARRGLLLLTGLLVDRGYGESKAEPLHFGIANVSRERLVIAFDSEPIASIQFFQVLGDVERRTTGRKEDPQGPKGFVLFTRLERQFDRLESKIDSTAASFNATVVLGAFVILATLVGSIAAILLGAISNDGTSHAISSAIDVVKNNLLPSTIVAVIAAAISIFLVAALLLPIGRLITARPKEASSARTAGRGGKRSEGNVGNTRTR